MAVTRSMQRFNDKKRRRVPSPLTRPPITRSQTAALRRDFHRRMIRNWTLVKTMVTMRCLLMDERRLYEEFFAKWSAGGGLPPELRQKSDANFLSAEGGFHEHLHGLLAKIRFWRRAYGERPPLIYRDDAGALTTVSPRIGGACGDALGEQT